MTEKKSEIEDYTSYQNFLSCSAVQDIEYEYRCEYVRNTTECVEKGFYFNYIEIMYCTFKPSSDLQLYALLLIFLCLVLVIFLILGTTADKYFCPSLEMLSKTLGLSEHLAGITLLAFGNGSPDLFTSLASLEKDMTTLFSNVLSGAIFVSAFVGGLVCVVRPFHINGSSLIRDTTFLLFGILYINYIMESDKYVTRVEAISFCSIYLFYIAIILTDLHLIKQRVKKFERSILRGAISGIAYKNYINLKEEAAMEIIAQGSRSTLNVATTRGSYYGTNVGPNENLVEQLLTTLNPIDWDNWSDGGYFAKALICIRVPINLFLALLIPNVDYEKERHGWSKLLNCIQIVTLPFVTFCLIFRLKSVLGVPIISIPLVLTIPLAYFVFKSTRTDISPRFHVGFACLSAYGAIFTIYSCASEIVEVLYILGLVLQCSNSFLGCTILAWGNGIGDMVANTALALHGYHKMAFAACIGGPFFNTMFCLGLVLVCKTISSEDGQINLTEGPLGKNCFVFLILVLFGTLMWSTTTNFYVRRSIGIFNLSLYALFFLYAILSEWEIIQTYADVKDYGLDDN